MTQNRGTRESHSQLDEFLHGLVDAGASIIALEKDVPVAVDQPGLVFRVTPGKMTESYPGLAQVQFGAHEITVECTIDNYGPPINDEDSPLNLLPIYVSEEFADPVSIEEGIGNVSGYLRGDNA